jgi:MoaA/NifB/PqqE/SkfB family radical SAM enzyme
MHRTIPRTSSNPDLIDPEIREARAQEILRFWRDREKDIVRRLDRMTVFVTHRCNLGCAYCNGPHLTRLTGDRERKETMLRRDLTVSSFETLAEEVARRGIVRHIHFTGGEATVNKDLPEFVRIATRLGILTSVTTNGTAPPEMYEELLRLGMTEIRVSIDTWNPAAFDAIVKSRNAWDKTVASIKAIVRARDTAFPKTFLCLNACVFPANFADLEQTVAFLVSLNPNDIKLLVVGEAREFIFAQDPAITERLLHLLDPYPGDFLLLRKKIAALLDPQASGFSVCKIGKVAPRCFVPLTERTFDGQHYYPCSIYLRYYGRPLGTIDEPMEKQEENILNFVRSHPCTEDPICSQHCVSCCKSFNVETMKKLATQDALFVPIDIAHDEVPDETVLAACIRQIRERTPKRSLPFLIIKPRDLPHAAEIREMAAESGLTVVQTAPIPCWEDISFLLYAHPFDPTHLRRRWLADQSYHRFEGGAAMVLWFDATASLTELDALKARIRARYPCERYAVTIGGTDLTVRISAVHSPADAEEAAYQNAVLAQFGITSIPISR